MSVPNVEINSGDGLDVALLACVEAIVAAGLITVSGNFGERINARIIKAEKERRAANPLDGARLWDNS